MSTKSKRRAVRRAKPDGTSRRVRSPKVPAAAERQAIGAIMGGLLNAITFGALEPGPQSQSRPR